MAYSAVYTFGDSLVDTGNALKLAQWYGNLTFSDLPEGAPDPALGYFQGRFSNGYNFADLVTNKYVGLTSKPVFPYGYDDPWLGIPIAPWASDPKGSNLNFAYGGAQIRQGGEVVPDLDGQTDAFRHAVDGNAPSGALYLVTMGGNDIRSLVPSSGAAASQSQATAVIQDAAGEMYNELNQLIGLGARNIVVTGVPDVGLVPKYDANADGIMSPEEVAQANIATQYSQQLDSLIQQQLTALRTKYANSGVTITYVSLDGAGDAHLVSLAQLYGVTVDYLLAHKGMLFFDQIHPNAQVHALLAASIVDSINGTSAGETLAVTAPDYTRASTIGLSGEVDRIVVSLAANASYGFELLGVSNGRGSLADPLVRVLGPGGVIVGSNDDGGLGLDSSFTFTAATAGDYVIELRGVGSLTGSYVFQASGNAPGNDVYTVGSSSAVILERAGEGNDTVRTSVNYALPATVAIETLTTTSEQGTAAINLTGNEFAQTIIGNAGNNQIDGRAGNDILLGNAGNDLLTGGSGSDTLTGGAGSDNFRFNTGLSASGNVDTITDFSVADDTFLLAQPIFSKIAATGALAASAFQLGTAANDALDRIVYDPASGKIWYDSDGNGSAAAILFAKVTPGTALTSLDFVVTATTTAVAATSTLASASSAAHPDYLFA